MLLLKPVIKCVVALTMTMQYVDGFIYNRELANNYMSFDKECSLPIYINDEFPTLVYIERQVPIPWPYNIVLIQWDKASYLII